MSNGCLQRQLKVIKSNRRTCIGEDTLRISVEGWDSRVAVDWWWKSKTRQVPTKDRYVNRSSTQSSGDWDARIDYCNT